MKTLFLTIATSIASGLALYYIARTALVSLIWLFDITLTNDQRLLVHELGFPTICAWFSSWWGGVLASQTTKTVIKPLLAIALLSQAFADGYDREDFYFQSYKPNTSIGFYTNQIL